MMITLSFASTRVSFARSTFNTDCEMLEGKALVLELSTISLSGLLSHEPSSPEEFAQ